MNPWRHVWTGAPGEGGVGVGLVGQRERESEREIKKYPFGEDLEYSDRLGISLLSCP